MKTAPKSSAKIIGIDLGTSYSVVSIWDSRRKEAVIIPNNMGDNRTPSVVSVNPAGEILVGDDAKRNLLIAPDDTVFGFMRGIGQDPKVMVWGQEFDTQTIAAFLLYYLKTCAEKYLGEPVHDAVITVPASYTEVQRRAVQDAARIAGLNVHRLINSATAAGVAFAVHGRNGVPKSEEKVYAIYDLGGGTFNASIIAIAPESVTVLGTDGELQLGGLDMDEAVMIWALHEIKQIYGVDIRDNEATRRRLKMEAEAIKETLVLSEDATWNLPYLTMVEGQPINVNLQLSRKQFDMLISTLIKRSLRCLEGAVASAEKCNQRGWMDLDGVLFVGGTTRLPIIREMLKEKLQEHCPSEQLEIPPDLNPDEVVAMGAAIVAAGLTPIGRPTEEVEDLSKEEIKQETTGVVDTPTINIYDVIGHSLGTVVAGNKFYRIIEKDTMLPVTTTLSNLTNPGPVTEIHIELYEGEEEFVDANTKVGRLIISGLEPLPLGGHLLEAEFSLDESGRLSVNWKDLRSQTMYEGIVALDGITPLSADELRAKRALFDGWPLQLPAENRYQALMAQAEEHHGPKQRLTLAKELFTFSQRRFRNIQTRLNILQQAVQLDPFSLQYRVALAQAEREGGLLDQAIAECRRALEHWPDSQHLLLLLGEVFLDKGEIGEARKHFEKAAESADPIVRTRAIYNKIECDLREASDKKDWEEVLDRLGVRLGSGSHDVFSVSHYEVLNLAPESLSNTDDKELAKIVRMAAKKARGEYNKAAQRGDKAAEKKINQIHEAERTLKDTEARKTYDELLTEHESSTVERESAIGLFFEKCLKVVVECNDQEIVKQVLSLVEKKIGSELGDNKAFQLIRRLSQFDPQQGFKDNGSKSEDLGHLEGLLRAYRLSQTKSVVEASDGETRIQTAGNWRNLVEAQRDHWPGLSEAYQHELHKWAQQAYKDKVFVLAGVLWQEAERLAPYNPSLLQNLAIVHTRLEQEHNYQWYWDRLTQTWTLYSEMMPEADGFEKSILQKHQVFTKGAQVKLRMLQTWQEFLELGEIWIKEAVSFLALQQLTFRNDYFRCGVMTDDWTNEEERQELLELACNSAAHWLEMIVQWQALGDGSALAQWRRERLKLARQVASESGEECYQFYDEERDAFKQYRENMLRQYSLLLLQVLMPLADWFDINDAKARKQFAFLGQGLISFPHRLLKSDLVKTLKEQKDKTQDRREQQNLENFIEIIEKDIDGLVQDYAIRPWFVTAQENLQVGNTKEAAMLLEEMLEIAPNHVLGMFYLAQCCAEEEKFEDAYKLLVKARESCDEKDRLLAHINNLTDQMDIARVRKILEPVQILIKQAKASDAILECKKVLQDYPSHPYVLFTLSQAYVNDLDIEEAKSMLHKAQKVSRKESELHQTIERNLEELVQYGPQIILAKAVPLMNKQHWKEAREILAKGQSLEPNDAQLTFYEALCWSKMEDMSSAEGKAQEALDLCHPDQADLRQEIAKFIKQIPMMIIGKDFEEAQKAMGQKQWSKALLSLDNSGAKLARNKRAEDQRKERAAEENRRKKAEEELRKKMEDMTAKSSLTNLDEDAQAVTDLFDYEPVVISAFIQPSASLFAYPESNPDWTMPADWRDAISGYPDQVIVLLFYKAICHYNLSEWDAAVGVAEKTLPLCKGAENKDIKKQLDDLLNAVRRTKKAAKMNPIMEAMNQGYYATALNKISDLLLFEPANGEARFLKAACLFRSVMNDINSGGTRPIQSMFDPVDTALDEAEDYGRWDPELSTQISALRENVKQVREQLRSMGIY